MSAAFLITLMEIYLWIGAAVAAVFLLWGIDRIDEDARGAYIFRPLLIPGAMLIWPLVLHRWWVLESGRDQWALRHLPPRRTHAIVAVLMAVGIFGALWVGVSAKQTWPADIAPVLLAEPTQ